MSPLSRWMRRELVSNADLADRIGEYSPDGVRKLRFGERGASIRVAARIHAITGGEIGPADLVPTARRAR